MATKPIDDATLVAALVARGWTPPPAPTDDLEAWRPALTLYYQMLGSQLVPGHRLDTVDRKHIAALAAVAHLIPRPALFAATES